MVSEIAVILFFISMILETAYFFHRSQMKNQSGNGQKMWQYYF